MVIEKILKQLTPERIKKEVETVQRIKLPPELQKWVKEYEKVGERSYFNFPWIYWVTQVIVFPGTIKKYREPLWTTKTLIFMFNILLDDIADRAQSKNFLEELIRIPFNETSLKNNHLNKKEKRYFKFAVKLWKYIDKTIKKYPRHKELRAFFDYDNRQYINAMRYAYLINKNHNLINKTESWLYISHGMQVFSIMDVDLMCSKFSTCNLGPLREIVWNFQKMSRIGNWVSTWEREIKDGDFTSGIWAYAIDKGIISAKELKKENEKKLVNIIRKAKIENILLKEWGNSYKNIIKLGKKISKKEFKKDLREFLLGIEKLLYLHLISRYHK